MSATKAETTHGAALFRLPEELVASSVFLLKRLGFIAKGQSLAAYDELGFNPYHYAILATLDAGTPGTQGAIAETLAYDKGQLVGLLDELEELGLVERHRDPDDRRRHIVRLTADGRRALGRLRTVTRRIEDEFLAPLSVHERTQLHALLLKVAERQLPYCSPG